MSTEIAIYDKLQSFGDMQKFGESLAKSGMFGVDNAAAGLVILATCSIERISPLEFIRTYDIIGGKPRKKAMAAFAEFRRKGGRVKWGSTGDDGLTATAQFFFEGSEVTVSYSIEQARKAGLLKPNGGWDKNPSNMLRARVISNGLGMLCPEIFAGADDDASPLPAGPALTLVAPEVSAPNPDEAAEAAMGLAPVAPAVLEAEVYVSVPAVAVEEAPAPAPAPAAVPPTAATRATVEELKKLQAVVEPIDGCFGLAMAWFVKEGWLIDGEPITHLSSVKVKRVLNNTASWLRAIGAKGGK